MAVADIEGVGGVHEVEKAHHVLVVIERLANAHHHDIGNAKPAVALGGNDLPEKLGGEQIAHPSA